MGRSSKQVYDAAGEDRRESGYYATPAFIADFLAERLLELRPSARTVLDPCIGKGELTRPLARAGLTITGIDIIDRQPEPCHAFRAADFLALTGQDPRGALPATDLIVANPPYNCHETDYIRANKPELIRRFGRATALNMYSLFVRAIIGVARPGCVIGLVVHDSFLTAVGHQALRRFLLAECQLRDLHLCPTALFRPQGADVRTCLMVLEKGGAGASGVVQVSNRLPSVDLFRELLSRRTFSRAAVSEVLLSGPEDHHTFVIGAPPSLHALFAEQRLGQFAPCVTGVSTGNDRKYLRAQAASGHAVPFYKNPASRRFFAAPDGYLADDYLDLARANRSFMVRNKALLLRGGLACSSMGVAFGATLRPENTLCGVNPNVIADDADRWWLLAYLNSRLCLYLLRGMLLRGNMVTAGYAARLPLPGFTKRTRNRLGQLAQEAFAAASGGACHALQRRKIDATLERALSLPEDAVDVLRTFADNPTRLS